MSLKVNEYTTYATFGLFSRFDVSVVIPMMNMRMGMHTTCSTCFQVQPDGSTLVFTPNTASAHATGIGDVKFRLKGKHTLVANRNYLGTRGTPPPSPDIPYNPTGASQACKSLNFNTNSFAIGAKYNPFKKLSNFRKRLIQTRQQRVALQTVSHDWNFIHILKNRLTNFGLVTGRIFWEPTGWVGNGTAALLRKVPRILCPGTLPSCIFYLSATFGLDKH
jgi:hypothetical protein